jgi:acyl transferase domain-containing protein
MLSVPLLETDLEPLLGSELSVAAVNGPGMCVASGPVAAIDALAGRLAERGLEARRLHIDVAAHSKLVAPILDEFGRLLATFLLSPPRTPFLSNVTGTWARAEEVTDPAYWVRHLRRTVRFGDGLAELMKTPRQVLLEVGPGRVLSNFAQAAPGRSPATVAMTSLRHPRDRQTDLETLLSTLGKLWLWGVDLDWRAFHAGERRLRVPLPTYPFERQSYLIEPRRTSGAARPHAATGRSDTADWFYVPAWRLMPPEAPAEEEQPRRHLLFLDAAGLGASLAERLEEHGHEVFTVRTGAAFARLHKRGFTLRPGEREDCERLLAALAESGDLPERIVHLWAVTADGGSEASAVAATSAAAVAAEQELGFHALAALAQALGEQPDTVGKVALTVVASGLHDISGGESSQPAKAPLLALCQAIQQEMPNVRCRSVDVVAPRPGSPATRRLTTQLLAEAAAEDAEPVIAYRGDRRWRRGFEPLSLHASRRAPLRQEGTYVIFGGTGRLGLAFAGRLAAAGRPSLALVSRRSLTPEAAERIGELRAHGAQVEVLNADLADREDLGRAMAAVLARFGRIDGVVHAAGVTGRQAFQTLRDLTRETCAELWRPKVQGLLALEEALSGLDLDFCVLTSCLSSILGGIGGVADAAANLFLEAFVQDHNRRSGQRWTALTWDRWETPGRGDATAVGRQRAILPEEGGIVFERALAAGPAGHLVISVSALESRLEQWREVQSGATAAAKGPDLHVRPGLSSSYVEPRDSVETALAGIFEDLLRIRPVGIYDNFFEMGGSSLIAAQILSRLRETFPVVLPPSVLFEAPTVAGLGELMRAADRDAVAAVETTEMVEMESGEI